MGQGKMAQIHLAVLLPLFLAIAGVATVPLSGNNRIHGGTDAEQGEFPYIISIRRIANAFKHMCAGVLIHPEWVLTSAFCVSEVGTYSIDAVGGEHNLMIPSADIPTIHIVMLVLMVWQHLRVMILH